MRTKGFVLILIVVAAALTARAEDGQGWTFSGRFQGSTNSAGLVTKADPTLGYSFNPHLRVYSGLPFYFVNQSTTTQTNSGFISGIGNAYVGLGLSSSHPFLDFSTNVEATAPTGKKDQGFSTGQATIDWTNRFSHSFSSVTPFANAGLANTVSDTAFFVRPFSSLGLVSHFDGGAKFELSKSAEVGASAYAVRAGGQQTIISKVFKKSATSAVPGTNGSGKNRPFENGTEIVGSADLANDDGFSTWFTAHASPRMDLQIGYTRSAGYDLNTVFFGIGFRFSN